MASVAHARAAFSFDARFGIFRPPWPPGSRFGKRPWKKTRDSFALVNRSFFAPQTSGFSQSTFWWLAPLFEAFRAKIHGENSGEFVLVNGSILPRKPDDFLGLPFAPPVPKMAGMVLVGLASTHVPLPTVLLPNGTRSKSSSFPHHWDGYGMLGASPPAEWLGPNRSIVQCRLWALGASARASFGSAVSFLNIYILPVFFGGLACRY